MAEQAPITVVETPDFLAAARKLLTEEERSELVDYLALHPEDGDVVQGSGGIRKLRWRLRGRGKRGGARVIYFFYSERIPLFALDLFAKNEKSDLAREDVNRLKGVVKLIAKEYLKGSWT